MNPQEDYYRIRLRGHLDPRWADWFNGFGMDYCDDDTVLSGPVVDQAVLHGVFAKIRDLGLVILFVENLIKYVEKDGFVSLNNK